MQFPFGLAVIASALAMRTHSQNGKHEEDCFAQPILVMGDENVTVRHPA
jgi:hypothetical protein